MGQVNLANMLIGSGYGASISGGGSGNASTTALSESFDKTLDRARDSSQSKNSSSSTKSTIQRDNSYQQVKKDEKAYENKEVQDRDRTQVTKKADTTSKEVQQEADADVDKKSEESKSQGMDEQILALVSQALNISVDEIKEALSQLGLETKDLMSQEGFSTFISKMCGQGSVADLLLNTDDLKSITALFESLSAMEAHDPEVSKLAISEQAIVKSLAEQELTQVATENVLKVENQQNPIGETQIAVTEQMTLNGEAVVASNKATERYSENTETLDQNLSFLQGQEQQTEGIGINVPVHNFTTTTSTQFFRSEAGIVTQTTITKSADGEAFINQIDFKVIGQTRELDVQLSPKELGNLNIKIIENNGVLVAEIKVDNNKAKDFILNEIHLLKESLEHQGLNVADVKVDIRQENHQSQMEQERQKSSKRIQDIIAKHFDEDEAVEEATIPLVGASEIDYMV